MNARQNRGGAAVLLLVFAAVLAAGLLAYMNHVGKLNLSFLRNWQVTAMNFWKQNAGDPNQTLDKILTVNLEDLSGSLNESQIVDRYRGAELSCFSTRHPLGDYSCRADIALFNDIPAREAVFFFFHGRLSGLRVAMPVGKLNELNAQLTKKFGEKGQIGLKDPQTARPLQGWKLAGGMFGINEFIPGERDAILLWAVPGMATTSGH